MVKILGIDLSTSIAGWCILEDGRYIDCGFLDLTRTKDIYEKLQIFIDFIKIVKVDKVYVEEALMMFKIKSSMAQVLARLQEFNGMCRAAIYVYLGLKSETINPMTARKLCGLHIPRKENTKEFVANYIKSLNLIPSEKWIYSKKGKNQRTNFDIADATIIALAAYEELKNAPR